MNIVLITSLYPSNIEHTYSDVTFAIHYIAKSWVSENNCVKVFVPWHYYAPVFRILNPKKYAYRKKYAYFERITIDNVEVNRIPFRKIPRISSMRRIKEMSKVIYKILTDENFKPDVLVVHGINISGFIAVNLKNIFKVPLILTLHKSDIKYARKFPQQFHYISSNVNEFAFRSYSIYNYFKNTFPNLKFNKIIIPTGIEEDEILDLESIKSKSENTPRKILYAGNLNKNKNVHTIIKALSILIHKLGKHHKPSLEIIGSGPLEKKLKKLVEKLGLNKRVIFTGSLPRETVLKRMRDSDIFVMVSLSETLGLVYFEAMASGCITIGSKGEGIDGFIIDGYNGYLVNPRDPSELAHKLISIFDMSPDDRYNILLNAVNTVIGLTNRRISEYYLNILRNQIE